MKLLINGRAKLPLLATSLTLATGLMMSSGLANAIMPTSPGSTEVQEEVGQRIQQLTRGDAEYSKELQYRIQDSFGVTASCGDEIFSTQAKNLECVQGLQNLELALSKLDPDAQRLVREVYVQISDSAQWGGLTYSDQELAIPFQAPPDVMAEFINKEVKLLNNVSLADVRKDNNVAAHKIESKYFVRVSSAPDLQPIVYHDGLERLNFALATLFVKNPPSPEEAAKLGFDRVTLGAKNKNLYEDDGELCMELNATDSPVEMQLRMISQIAQPKSHWYEHLKFLGMGPNTLSGSSYTWEQIAKFRDNRRQARQALEWLEENAPQIHVTCNLKSSERYSIDMAQCAQGVTTIQHTIAKYRLTDRTPAFQNLIVGSLWFSSMLAQKYRDALLIKYDASEKTIYRALVQK